MSITSLRPEPSERWPALEKFAREHDLDIQDLANRLFDALNDHVEKKGYVAYPLIAQFPSEQCHKCPMCPPSAPAQSNIIPFS